MIKNFTIFFVPFHSFVTYVNFFIYSHVKNIPKLFNSFFRINSQDIKLSNFKIFENRRCPVAVNDKMKFLSKLKGRITFLCIVVRKKNSRKRNGQKNESTLLNERKVKSRINITEGKNFVSFQWRSVVRWS